MKKKYLYIIILALAFSCWVAFEVCNRMKVELDRLEANQGSLLKGFENYRTSDSLNAIRIDALTLKRSELLEHNKELKERLDALNIKLKRLQSYSVTGTTTTVEVKVPVFDSVFIETRDTVKCVHLSDNYITLDGCIQDSLFAGKIEIRDTLVQIIHRVPRKFWFIRYGCKAIRQEIICKNPYTIPIYTSYIELRRRRK